MSDAVCRGPAACADMPVYACWPGIYEIDEFDCASCFLIVGERRALLVDTGVGIGDLKGLVERRLDGMPYDVLATHKHGDHIGGAGWFDDIWIHPADANWQRDHTRPTLEFRRDYAALIRGRGLGPYPYDPEADIRPWPGQPAFRMLSDGQRFDLGGRVVTAWHCPGHTPGEVVLTDDATGALLCGDACNCNWLLSGEIAPTPRGCAETALSALRRVLAMAGREYDPGRVINSHHDFRPAGRPLDAGVMTDLEACLESLLRGDANRVREPDPLSPDGGFRTVARTGSVTVACMGGGIEYI